MSFKLVVYDVISERRQQLYQLARFELMIQNKDWPARASEIQVESRDHGSHFYSVISINWAIIETLNTTAPFCTGWPSEREDIKSFLLSCRFVSDLHTLLDASTADPIKPIHSSLILDYF